MREREQAGIHKTGNHQVHDSVWRLEDGFSTAIALVAISTLSLLAAGLGVALGVAQFQVNSQLTADAVALTASDTALGAIAGYPCENAELIAKADGAILTSCRIVGLGAVVQTTQNLGFIEVSRWAEAGPLGGTK